MKKMTRIFNGLGTANIVTAVTDNAEKLKKSLDKVQRLVEECDRLWSVYREDSIISKLNRYGYIDEADERTRKIVSDSVMYGRETEGSFDITTLPLNILWKNAIKSKKLPKEEDIEKVRNLVGYEKIEITERGIRLGEGQKTDLGGIAKGFALRLASDILLSSGITKGAVNLGGSLRIIGEGEGEIRNPFLSMREFGEQPSVMSVSLSDKFMVTSGTYEQEFIKDGVSFHHIINPRTAFPATSRMRSVTLIGDEPAALDAYATAVFLMEKEKALGLLKAKGIEAVIILNGGEILVTDGIKDKIKLKEKV